LDDWITRNRINSQTELEAVAIEMLQARGEGNSMRNDFPYPSGNRRVHCPQCDSSDGFAPAIENPEWGHCFACGYKNYPNTKSLYDNPIQSVKPKLRKHKNLREEHHDCRFVDDEKVADSLSYLQEIPLDPNRECSADEERAAIMEYEAAW